MKIKLYNTLTRTKEQFKSAIKGQVSMYICGPTVYNYIHIGNARTYVSFDVICRFMLHLGQDLTLIRNITDVDDKIINRAQTDGVSTDDIVATYTEAFDEDMDKLAILAPDVVPKATEHIDEMIDMIRRLEQKDIAYNVDGDVYFAVEKFPGYGKLSNRKLDELRSGERIEPDPRKRSTLDFALWKSAKPGEPAWQSPWGPGRPGWHIECSAMSEKYLGTGFDVHGGGLDLIFPHHENEIAQSEAATGKEPFVRTWVHGGMVNINSEKMAKSVGNIILLRDLLDEYDARDFRLFCLSTHYRSPIDFSWDRMIESRTAISRVIHSLANIDYLNSVHQLDGVKAELSPHEKDLLNSISKTGKRFDEVMSDDINTPLAIGSIFELVREMNHVIDLQYKNTTPCGLDTLVKAKDKVIELFSILGIVIDENTDLVSSIPDEVLEIAEGFIEIHHFDGNKKIILDELLQKREEARVDKDWTLSDGIRNNLKTVGVLIEDTNKGPRWKLSVDTSQ